MTRIHFWLTASLLALALPSAQALDIKPVDNIVAVVNDDVITRQELDLVTAQMRSQLPKGQNINTADLQQQALAQLIRKDLLIQAAKRANIRLSNADINEAIEQFAAQRHMSVKELIQRIAKEGINENQLRRTMTENLLAQKIEQSEVMGKSQVSDAEVDDAIARAQQEGRQLPPPVTAYSYHVQHILLKNDNDITRKLIEQIAQQARSGASFEQLARQYSQDGSAQNGGDLGWIIDGETVPPFEAAVKSLRPGQISLPVRTQFGWHVIRLVDVRSNDSPSERQRNGMRAVLVQEKREILLQNFLKQLHDQAYINIRPLD
ncbi:Survival protein SurA precursor (Peptidyl-prolyl cis-trans isomerase SurA) [Snodgrassella communis]|uniref:peptidylprolyl isomerase n=1 Tax=Snodgrassella communis TaxID=2946699 RepID=UPI000460FE3D|nr:peptidylprolyl isomerase [Snodgrassella communis]KDN13441.1 Survival protein SurA precursor (Peptidyl-prolyl cis-trans isomerase SurA) [Snodgrassella communis]